MTIRELRILPPFAIGRLGSAAQPLDNYTLEEDPQKPLDFHHIKGDVTLTVNPRTGEISGAHVPKTIDFKDGEHIRPVAPFLEVFAVTADGQLVPLTLALLKEAGLGAADVQWQVSVANRKVARRTGDAADQVDAQTKWFSSHGPQRLKGTCPHFVRNKSIDFGEVRYIRPSVKFPEIRLRFTPPRGLIYGPVLTEEEKAGARKAKRYFPEGDLAVYALPQNDPTKHDPAKNDPDKGWWGFQAPDDEQNLRRVAAGKKFISDTQPPSLYAIDPPAPSWLHDDKAVSRGYFDDTSDGFVQVRLTVKGQILQAAARICAGPPMVVPDTLFLRNLADDLDQVIYGPRVPADETAEETRARAIDIVRRAFDTVRFLNVAVMNGNPVKGRNPLTLDTMPAEEAFDVSRQMRPIVPERTADTLAIMTLHQQVFAALQAGAAPWFARILRLPNEVADYTDHGRRKMPAMMCGADGSYLALTYRQINAVFRAAGLPLVPKLSENEKALEKAATSRNALTPRNLSAQVNHEARGNPISTRPITSVANCTPGLEVDFRAVWRRCFAGIVLREWDNLVLEMDPPGMDASDAGKALPNLVGHRLLCVNRDPVVTQMVGPSPADGHTRSIVLGTPANPEGVAPLEWSNALSRVLHECQGGTVTCYFTKEPVWTKQFLWTGAKDAMAITLKVRPFFEPDSALISRALAGAGELTQGLCSPWQNDYRECSCYYWASARPDFVNVKISAAGTSIGDNWMQKHRTGDYVPDDYVDSRLIDYDNLFKHWEKHLRFQVKGNDQVGPVDCLPLPDNTATPVPVKHPDATNGRNARPAKKTRPVGKKK